MLTKLKNYQIEKFNGFIDVTIEEFSQCPEIEMPLGRYLVFYNGILQRPGKEKDYSVTERNLILHSFRKADFIQTVSIISL